MTTRPGSTRSPPTTWPPPTPASRSRSTRSAASTSCRTRPRPRASGADSPPDSKTRGSSATTGTGSPPAAAAASSTSGSASPPRTAKPSPAAAATSAPPPAPHGGPPDARPRPLLRHPRPPPQHRRDHRQPRRPPPPAPQPEAAVIDNLALYLAAGQSLHPVADWAVDQVLLYGPGFALIAGCIAVSVTCPRIRDILAPRRHIRTRREQLRHDRQHMARLSDAINQAPRLPTQPGTDQDLLDACWDAWNTDTRKEKP